MNGSIEGVLDHRTAAAHPSPYPWYADLVVQHPIYRDGNIWVVSGADLVRAVFQNPHLCVRPAAQSVPESIAGSGAGSIFQRLVRMSEGEQHARLKPAVAAALAAIGQVEVEQIGRAQAARLLDVPRSAGSPPFHYALSSYVIGSLLGISESELPRVAALMDAFARCIAPGGTPEQIAAGIAATDPLVEIVKPQLVVRRSPLLNAMMDSIGSDDHDIDLAIANGIGFLFQAYDATAGLIGNSILALRNRPELLAAVRSESGLLERVLGETMRWDSPAQNTRRFAHATTEIGGNRIEAGDEVLVLIGAANRDPTLNPDPDRFDPERTNRRSFGFGDGRHGCPGDALALGIAFAGTSAVIQTGLIDHIDLNHVVYRPSPNTRVPLFAEL